MTEDKKKKEKREREHEHEHVEKEGEERVVALPRLALRGVVGGVLMGLANLVPGISGGTMLLAAGVYPRFIRAIAELTTLKFRMPSLVVLGTVGLSALLAIGSLAGVVKNLVVHHRWIMYSLFIGLTLGGVPVVWKMAGKATRGLWLGAGVGFCAMAALALAQTSGLGETGGDSSSFVMLVLAGVAGASAMILPGVSGGYLLLVLGQYVAILGGIHAVTVALKARDLSAAWDPILGVVLPVGLGVVVGIVVVSNLLKVLLARYEKPTLGVLLGLLLGAVVGLWPFQAGVKPALGDTVRGQVITADKLDILSPDKWPTDFFSPSVLQIFAALGLLIAGFAITALVARFGQDKDAR
jgi:putative membrane protein